MSAVSLTGSPVDEPGHLVAPTLAALRVRGTFRAADVVAPIFSIRCHQAVIMVECPVPAQVGTACR